MLDNFPAFAKMVAKSFQELTQSQNIFVVNIASLYEEYLGAFPEGTNPLFRTRTEHDCSCCKHFVRRVGAVVTLDGGLRTIWDGAAEKAPKPYQEVASHLRDVIRNADISDLFRVGEKEINFGVTQSHSFEKDTGRALTWDHFYTGEIPKNLRSSVPDQVRGDYRTTVQVFERGLTELDSEAVKTAIGLVEANSLYRGEEHKPALLQFEKTQRKFLALETGFEKNTFVWANAGNPAARFRNTVIGTLVQDLSEGQDLERAVKSFETKVAPQNYKRTTALITPGMVKKAMETIEALGLESALERRFAVIGDLSVNDVKWVDGSIKPLMKGGIRDVLMKHATTRNTDEQLAEEISIDDLMDLLPDTTGLEILFKSEHVGNLMSLTAPCHPEPKQLFRWSNDFAWSYCGNVADSIKERVRKAGGKVENVALRVSLSWFNYDDLDLHILQPEGRGLNTLTERIYFGSKKGWTGGELDVDMNAGRGTTREAVENVVWSKHPPDGPYKVVVHNYARRETDNPGFVIEVENNGKLSHYSYNKGVTETQYITVTTLHVKNGIIERVETNSSVTSANVSQEKWGLKTGQFVKVSAVTLSPNYWGDNAVGNRHVFFVIEGALNDELTRGFYNEFLHPRLEPHRKVFEVIGDKTKCQPTEGQLSGLGFSSTKQESFIVLVRQGKKKRMFNVRVGDHKEKNHDQHLRVRSAQ